MAKAKNPGGNKGSGGGYCWLVAHKDYAGDDCLTWPFSRNQYGYGQLGFQGRGKKANRVMCELAHGKPPTPKHHAAHSCGNGHLGCVNPRHLKWKTPRENQLDRRRHGTHRGAKGSRATIPLETINDIRRSKQSESIEQTAARLGLTHGCVRYWRDTTHAPAPPGTHPETIRWRLKKAAQPTRVS